MFKKCSLLNECTEDRLANTRVKQNQWTKWKSHSKEEKNYRFNTTDLLQRLCCHLYCVFNSSVVLESCHIVLQIKDYFNTTKKNALKIVKILDYKILEKYKNLIFINIFYKFSSMNIIIMWFSKVASNKSMYKEWKVHSKTDIG